MYISYIIQMRQQIIVTLGNSYHSVFQAGTKACMHWRRQLSYDQVSGSPISLPEQVSWGTWPDEFPNWFSLAFNNGKIEDYWAKLFKLIPSPRVLYANVYQTIALVPEHAISDFQLPNSTNKRKTRKDLYCCTLGLAEIREGIRMALPELPGWIDVPQ